MNTVEYIDACKAKLGITSDYRFSKVSDIPENRLSDYRKGARSADVFACFKFAEILGESPSKVIADLEAQNARSEHKALFFKHFLTSVGLWIVLAVIPLYSGVHSESALAGGIMGKGVINQHNSPLYEVIRSRVYAFLRWLSHATFAHKRAIVYV